MKYLVFAVRDRKADGYSNPFYHVTKGHAIRAFTDEVNRAEKDNMLYKHPGDFDLYFLGEWNPDTADFECGRPEQIAIGEQVAIRGDTNAR